MNRRVRVNRVRMLQRLRHLRGLIMEEDHLRSSALLGHEIGPYDESSKTGDVGSVTEGEGRERQIGRPIRGRTSKIQ